MTTFTKRLTMLTSLSQLVMTRLEASFHYGSRCAKVIHRTGADVEQVYFPHAEVVGDVGPKFLVCWPIELKVK